MPKRSFGLYVLVTILFIGLILWVLGFGEEMASQAGLGLVGGRPSIGEVGIFSELMANFTKPLNLLLLQIIVILAVSKVFGSLVTKIGQPSVVGEIAAGIILGPSILGLVFPGVFGFLFPLDSLKILQFLSQIGLVFFMFTVGMELDLHRLKNKAYHAVVVSHASIVIPYFLGVLLSLLLYFKFAPAGIGFVSFALFMGIAMSITAFPVLARIIQERGLSKTSLGTLAITCAAADDVTAWCILAVVIAIVKANGMAAAAVTIVLALLFVGAMFFLVRPALHHFLKREKGVEKFRKSTIATGFLVLLGSAYCAEIIGVHALFGAFIAGTVMPHAVRFKELMAEKVEDVSLLVLLPIFFALTGLRTQIGLLNDPLLWGICALTIFTAIAGKFGGSAIAAKCIGLSWKEALSIGALMNTRGLMELIVLNIGYDLGILPPQIFSIMVLMALTTTVMTGPSLSLIDRFFRSTRSPDLV